MDVEPLDLLKLDTCTFGPHMYGPASSGMQEHETGQDCIMQALHASPGSLSGFAAKFWGFMPGREETSCAFRAPGPPEAGHLHCLGHTCTALQAPGIWERSARAKLHPEGRTCRSRAAACRMQTLRSGRP